MCSSTLPYDGTVCRHELSVLTNCLPDTEQDGFVHIQSDQTETVGPLLDILKAFANDDCKAAALPFLCVYFFGLCDSTGKAHRPSSSQCTEISTGVCAREWTLASDFPGATLPDCSSFPDETVLMIMETCDSTADTTMDNELPSAMASGKIIRTTVNLPIMDPLRKGHIYFCLRVRCVLCQTPKLLLLNCDVKTLTACTVVKCTFCTPQLRIYTLFYQLMFQVKN